MTQCERILQYIDENGSIRHDELKTAYMVFSWLMDR
jgi:hypothetical protein